MRDDDKIGGWRLLRQHEALPRLLPWVTGRFYGHAFAAALTTGAIGGTNMQAVPFYVPNLSGVTATSLGIEVTAGGGGSTVRLGIYNATSSGQPGALLVDGGTAATTGTGFVSVSLSQRLAQGWWYAASTYATSSGFPTVRRINTVAQVAAFGTDGPADTAIWIGYLAYGATAGAASAAANGLPGHWPLWTGVILPDTTGLVDRLLVGI